MIPLDSLWTDYCRPDLAERAGKFSIWNKLDNPDRYKEVSKDRGIRTYSDIEFGYQFNSFGFRSAEFDNSENFKILYTGCSVTEGIGLPVEHTWSHHLNSFISNEIGDGVKMFNIGKAGSSIDACIRFTYITIEHKKFRPDFVFFLIPPINRNELVYVNKTDLGWLDFAPANAQFKNFTEQSLFHNYQNVITQLQRFEEAIRNLLFFKSFLDAKGIPFVLSTWCSSRINEIVPGITIPQYSLFKNYFPPELLEHYIVAPFVQDESKPHTKARLTPEICFSFDAQNFEYKYPYNISRDGIHLGPNTNWNFAKSIWSELQQRPNFSVLLNEKSRIYRS